LGGRRGKSGREKEEDLPVRSPADLPTKILPITRTPGRATVAAIIDAVAVARVCESGKSGERRERKKGRKESVLAHIGKGENEQRTVRFPVVRGPARFDLDLDVHVDIDIVPSSSSVVPSPLLKTLLLHRSESRLRGALVEVEDGRVGVARNGGCEGESRGEGEEREEGEKFHRCAVVLAVVEM
jgi:hypothetical protein